MEGKDTRRRKQPDEGGGEEGGSRAKITLIFEEEEEEEDVEEFQIAEEMVVEVMKRLEEEIRSPSPSALDHHKPPSFVTTSGNEESCGSSFSDSASTVMASVDTQPVVGVTYFVGGPSDRATAAEIWPWAAGLVEEGRGTSVAVPAAGCVYEEEEEEDDEEWLARVLGGVMCELEEGLV